METLILVLKKKPFEMIASGEKKEEYREIKDYWKKRFFNKNWNNSLFRQYDRVQFRLGYQKDAPKMLFELTNNAISIGIPNPKWSFGMSGEHFIIKLGQMLYSPDIKPFDSEAGF